MPSASSTWSGASASNRSRTTCMATIIRDKSVVVDPWLRLDLGPGGGLPQVPSGGDVIVPLALWQSQRDALLARPGRLGVWLKSDDEPGAIAEDLRLFGVV